MRFSLWPKLSQPWPEVVEIVRHAEASGWDGVYVADHFMGDGGLFGAVTSAHLESTAALAALAGLTTRVRLGTLVLGNTYRHPTVVANWAASVDRISDGRLVLGLGAGWQANEHEQYGITLPVPGERLARLDEACSVLRGLLTEPVVTFPGRYYELTDAVCEPKPVQRRLPLLIGGKGDRMLRLVARHADEWNMWAMPETIAERGAVLDRHCEEIGRDPSSITRSTQALVRLTDSPCEAKKFIASVHGRPAVAGPAEAFGEMVVAWREAGVDEVIVPDLSLGSGAQRLEALDALIEQGREAAG
ncbi:MAG: TIGR03560 family F420-dependent LLM class oxidoreductase [Intrasporangium sp.]|uniref:TIGR03560 family F420-dependent LLM class oxidoreductase n=1 Tax=Intrasporangium sp. TaxID=1925024 RepID=UPI003F8212CD